MRKLFAGFFLTLRWLLVLLLPVLGLVGGLWLMPEAKPKWEVTNESSANCVGAIRVNGNDYLVIETGLAVDEAKQTVGHHVIGLDWVTGKIQFKRTIPWLASKRMELLPDTTYAVFWDKYPWYSYPLKTEEVKLYDWNTNEWVASGIVPKQHFCIQPVAFSNNVLAGRIGSDEDENHDDKPLAPSNCKMMFWHLQGIMLTPTAKTIIKDSDVQDIQLNADGSDALYRGIDFSGHSQIRVIETNQGKILQTLSEVFVCARWIPDTDAFMALLQDEKNNSYFWQRFDRLGDNFVPAEKQALARFDRVETCKSDSFVVLSSKSSSNPIRRKLGELLGKDGKKTLEHLWPARSLIAVHRTNTGELVQRFTIPLFKFDAADELGNMKSTFHVDPTGQGLVLLEAKRFSYWELYPVTRWYPRVSLAVGVLLAIGLAWLNLRRSAKRATMSHVMR